ncbi:hypothetical protein TRIUR3_03691 [Triticum urartu]|uniref:Uncharacterized protein n=1 Tax=Triticum urartu TaxID=4572 RepID=M7YEE3_TRIUA|nr:hypothetical protein TRIUR3_03691 [Triticum urartu]
MERCEMDVGRSGHGAAAEGGVGLAAAAGAVGGDHGHLVVTAGGDVAARGPVHLGCHGGQNFAVGTSVLASLDMFSLSYGEPQWPVAASVPSRCLPVQAGVNGADGGHVHWFVPALPEF